MPLYGNAQSQCTNLGLSYSLLVLKVSSKSKLLLPESLPPNSKEKILISSLPCPTNPLNTLPGRPCPALDILNNSFPDLPFSSPSFLSSIVQNSQGPLNLSYYLHIFQSFHLFLEHLIVYALGTSPQNHLLRPILQIYQMHLNRSCHAIVTLYRHWPILKPIHSIITHSLPDESILSLYTFQEAHNRKNFKDQQK